jgi:LysM repeat protein
VARETYWILGAALAAALSLLLLAILSPIKASAFWPFSTPADASGTSGPIFHDPALALLDAATNVDPNPTKGVSPVALSDGSALVADAGPAGATADVNGSLTPGQISLYTVRSGDTLGDISKMFGVSINTIAWANNLGSARSIHPGQQLVILPVSGVEHKVVKGDTLASIAKKYHADAGDIAEFNGLDSGALLEVGSTIIVPGGELAISIVTSAKRLVVNPYRGGSGAEVDGYYGNPVPGAALTQGIHGWNGVDLGAPRGTPIYAAAAGVVIVARNNGGWNGGYGNYVVITHANGTQTLYAHMTHSIVSIGQMVDRGQLIGYVGATGEATGPHLHFEVRGARNPFASCPLGAVCQPK